MFCLINDTKYQTVQTQNKCCVLGLLNAAASKNVTKTVAYYI